MGSNSEAGDQSSKINLSENSVAKFFFFFLLHLYFFRTTKSGLSSEPHAGIICDWLLQPRFSRTRQKDAWGDRYAQADLPGRWLMLCVQLICTTLPETAERGWGTQEHMVLSAFDKKKKKKKGAAGNALFLFSQKQCRCDLDSRNTASNPPRCSDNLYRCYHRCFQ